MKTMFSGYIAFIIVATLVVYQIIWHLNWIFKISDKLKLYSQNKRIERIITMANRELNDKRKCGSRES